MQWIILFYFNIKSTKISGLRTHLSDYDQLLGMYLKKISEKENNYQNLKKVH